MLAELLADWGFETELSHDALSALRVIEDGHFDVALLDIGLPVWIGTRCPGQTQARRRAASGQRLDSIGRPSRSTGPEAGRRRAVEKRMGGRGLHHPNEDRRR